MLLPSLGRVPWPDRKRVDKTIPFTGSAMGLQQERFHQAFPMDANHCLSVKVVKWSF